MADEKTDLSDKVYEYAWDEIEEYDKVMLITWNPKPRFYAYDPYGDNNYPRQWNTMLEVLCEAYRTCSRFAFVPEISEDGKLHMHGWYVIKDRLKYHKSFLPSLRKNGFIKKSKARSHEWKTFKYHVKELEITREYLPDYESMVITHMNYMYFKKLVNLQRILNSEMEKNKKLVKKYNVLKMIEDYSSSSSIEFLSEQ